METSDMQISIHPVREGTIRMQLSIYNDEGGITIIGMCLDDNDVEKLLDALIDARDGHKMTVLTGI